MSSPQSQKPKFSQRIVRAFATGMVIGVSLATLGLGVGAFLAQVNPATPLTSTVLGGLSFAVGFGGSVSIELSKDMEQ
jgi:Mg/Co/Ni transporter MgtE